MTTHTLKCWPVVFDAIVAGKKPFEVRKNDRDFCVGDTLQFREWEPQGGEWSPAEDRYLGIYTGRQTWLAVTWVHPTVGDDPPVAAVARGYVVLGLGPIPVPPRAADPQPLRPSFSAVPPRPAGVAWEADLYCYAEITARGGLYVRREIERVHLPAFLAWANGMCPDRTPPPTERETYE